MVVVVKVIGTVAGISGDDIDGGLPEMTDSAMPLRSI